MLSRDRLRQQAKGSSLRGAQAHLAAGKPARWLFRVESNSGVAGGDAV